MSKIRSKISSIEPNFDEKSILSSPTSPPFSDERSTNTPQQNPQTITNNEDAQSTRWIFWTTGIMASLWVLAVIIIIWGYFDLGTRWSTLSLVQLAGLVMLVFAPALMLITTGYAMKRLAMMTVDGKRIAYAAQALSQPDVAAAENAQNLATVVRRELDTVDERLAASLSNLGALQGALAKHSEQIKMTGLTATEQTASMANSLAGQRDAMAELTHTFDKRIAAVSAMLETHAETLSKQQDMAEQKVQEARIGVETAAEKINKASDTVRSNTLQAAAALSGSHEDIKSLGEIIRTRSEELDATYTKHANALTAMIENLRGEQEALSGELEDRLAAMRDMSLSAKVSAESLTAASAAGKDTVKALAESATLANSAIKQRFVEMEEMVRISSLRAETLNEKAVKRVNESLSSTREEIARIEADMERLQSTLNEERPVTEALEFVEAPPALDPKIETQTGRSRRKRIRLKPLEDDFPPVEVPDQTRKPNTPNRRPAEPKVASTDPLSMQMDIEPPDLSVPDDNSDIVNFEPPNALSRPASTEEDKPARRGLFGLFGGRQKEEEQWRWKDMLATLDEPTAANLPLINGEDIIARLTSHGFSPDVMVDDGCVIEAANTCASRGTDAMTAAVAHRLSLPVRHLSELFQTDLAFRTDAGRYCGYFGNQITAEDGNREGIRRLLETPNGRAFLLCEAALDTLAKSA